MHSITFETNSDGSCITVKRVRSASFTERADHEYDEDLEMVEVTTIEYQDEDSPKIVTERYFLADGTTQIPLKRGLGEYCEHCDTIPCTDARGHAKIGRTDSQAESPPHPSGSETAGQAGQSEPRCEPCRGGSPGN